MAMYPFLEKWLYVNSWGKIHKMNFFKQAVEFKQLLVFDLIFGEKTYVKYDF